MRTTSEKTSEGLLAISTFLIPFYFFRFKIAGIPGNIFEVAVLGVALATLIVALVSRSRPKFLPISRIVYFFSLLFLVSAILGVVRAGASMEALGILKGWVAVPMLLGVAISYQFLSAADYPESKNVNYKFRAIFYGLYASTLVVSVWAIMQQLKVITVLFYQLGDATFTQYLGANFRAFGPFESPNYLAMFLVPTIFITLALWSRVKRKEAKFMDWLFYSSMLLPLLALIFSRSRAGLIALAVSIALGLLFYVFNKSRSKNEKLIYAVLGVIFAILAVAVVVRYGLRPDSDAVRFEIYQHAWQMVKGNWLWGIGVSNFQQVLSGFDLQPAFRMYALPYALHPHNLYLALWLNFGILGLVSFAGIVWYVITISLQSKSVYSLLLLMSLLAILLHGVFDTTYFKNDLSAIFWLIVALTAIEHPKKING